jgi:hypothetical protein
MSRVQEETDARTIGALLMSAPDPLPLVSASAVVGNSWREDLNKPVTEGPLDHGSNGLFQWRLDRLDGPEGLRGWAQARGLPWNTIPTQVAFFKWECKTKYPHLWAQLLNPPTDKQVKDPLATLTLNICDQYERPSEAGRVPDIRIAYARRAEALLQGQTPAPLPTPTPAPLPTPIPTPTPEPSVTTPVPLPVLQGLLPVLVQLFEAFGKGFATVVVDRLLGGKLPIPLPLPLPSQPSTTTPTVSDPAATPAPTLNISDLTELLNRVDTALGNIGKSQ